MVTALWLLCVPVALLCGALHWADEIDLYASHRDYRDGRPGPAPARPEPAPARSAWVPPPIAVVVVTVMVVLRVWACVGAP